MSVSLYSMLAQDPGVGQDEIGNHESDLHFKDTPDTRRVVGNYQDAGGAAIPQMFTSEIDGQPWFEVPFAYDPFWQRQNDLTSAR